ncbi:MAG: chemotaxis protein CheW [bacterium]|jgi:purine-binding chemotaxis protein CheW|nr:MAG: hypothetical protein DIU52_09500 [bacterium]
MTAAVGAGQVVVVRIADERFAVDAALVDEVVDGVHPHPLPGLPAHGRGVLEHRGEWLPAIDPAPLLAIGRTGAEPTAALIVRRGAVRFALAVDAVLSVTERLRAIVGPMAAAPSDAGREDGALLLEDEEGVITMLRPDDLFEGAAPEESGGSRMTDQHASATPIPIVSFRLGADAFGVEVQQVQEVIAFQPPRRVPHAPEFIEGVIDVRGTVVPVVDLRKRLQIPATPPNADTRVLLASLGQERIGLVVDAVMEVTRIPPTDIAEPPSIFRGLAARYLAGLARVGSGLLILLRLDQVLTSEERLALLGIGAEGEGNAPTSSRAGGKRARRREE